MFVRTVWVDGMRHAVLTPDDPVVNPRLRRPPRASTSTEKSFPAQHQRAEAGLDRLNSCFMNLHVVVEKNFSDGKLPPRIARRQSAPPCTRMRAEKAGSLLEIYMKDVDKLDEDHVNCQTLKNAVKETTFPTGEDFGYVGQSLRLRQDAFSAATECKQADRSSDAHWNPLSERVLQWLDLSGRAQDYELGTEESPRIREDRRWRRRRRHLSQTREDSLLAERERVVVQNYRLQKNSKLECETKFARKRQTRVKDKTEEDGVGRKEESDGSKARVAGAGEDDLGNENEPQDDWSPPGRLQLHIVMPSFNSVEKRASSLESLACD